MVACGTVLRVTAPQSMSGNEKSAAYFACPETLPFPSVRGTGSPIVDPAVEGPSVLTRVTPCLLASLRKGELLERGLDERGHHGSLVIGRASEITQRLRLRTRQLGGLGDSGRG